jgi:hypothetical protein
LSLALLLAATAATAAGAAALLTAHGLRKQLTALRAELTADLPGGASVPAARATPAAEIRAAVADALAEERERELAEARAFWAAQEARDSGDGPGAPGRTADPGEDLPLYLPRQADFAGLEKILGPEVAEVLESIDAVDAAIDAHEQAPPPSSGQGDAGKTVEDTTGRTAGKPSEDTAAGEPPELTAARRRHPSHPNFSPAAPASSDHDRTISRLDALASSAVSLVDVRPGPLGTLDVYLFSDGTTVCMTPGHRETAERLGEALRAGVKPVLLGGSAVSGAFALTFACGEDMLYVLADRVIATL